VRVVGVGAQRREAHHRQAQHLGARLEALALGDGELLEVVDEADRGEAGGQDHGQHDVEIVEPAPQQHRP
jgi:hypothetical protein